MKKSLLIAVMGMATLGAKAQAVVDTVLMGASGADQVFYSLPNDETGRSARTNWELGFKTGGFSSDILVNSTGKGGIWLYNKGTKSAWSSVTDTVGLSTWQQQFDAEKSWVGTLGRYLDPADASGFDLGWGKYSLATHTVSGDSLYIVRTQSGAFRKLIIDKLASGTYTFTYANLDGTDSTTATLAKATYTGKNRGYYSLDSKAAVDREPMTAEWDLSFQQYMTGDYAAMGMAGYPVTGILVNDTLEVALAKVKPADRPAYDSYAAHSFSRDINGIGYNWKTFTGGTYVYNDSSVYFVKRNNGDIWKVIMLEYSSATGRVVFSKEKIFTAGGVSVTETALANTTVVLSPNPVVAGRDISVVYNLNQPVAHAQVQVYDLSGRAVINARLETTAGMHAYTFATASMAAGTYIVNVVAGTEQTQHKFIVQ